MGKIGATHLEGPENAVISEGGVGREEDRQEVRMVATRLALPRRPSCLLCFPLQAR